MAPLITHPAQTEASAGLRPSLLNLLMIWLAIGATSFGGGAATQLLIQHHFVVRRRWITPEVFARDWAIVQCAPGINLIALTVLIGRRLCGAAGVVVSLFGLLVPAILITVLMTALYARVRTQPEAIGALRGITPALVGLGAVFMWRLLKGPLGALRQRGRLSVVAGLAVLIVTAALTAIGVPVLISSLTGAVGLGVIYGLTPCESSRSSSQ